MKKKGLLYNILVSESDVTLYEGEDAKKYDAHIVLLKEGKSKNISQKTKLPRYYMPESCSSLIESCNSMGQVKCNELHAFDDNFKPVERPFREWVGVIENFVVGEKKGKKTAEGDITVFADSSLKERIHKAPKFVGFSIFAKGDCEVGLIEGEKYEKVFGIDKPSSIDACNRPAAGGGVDYLYESDLGKAWESEDKEDDIPDALELFEKADTILESEMVEGVELIESASPEDISAQKARSKKYGISIRKDGNVTKPSQYSSIADSDFADPVNYSYPITKEYVAAAAKYWGKPANKAKYSSGDQAKISARIASAEKKFGVGVKKVNLKEGVISVADELKDVTIENLTKERPDLVESIQKETVKKEQSKLDAKALVLKKINASKVSDDRKVLLIEAFGEADRPEEKLDSSIKTAEEASKKDGSYIIEGEQTAEKDEEKGKDEKTKEELIEAKRQKIAEVYTGFSSESDEKE